MRAVVQRVSHGRVSVSGSPVAEIGRGYVILLGIGHGDGEAQIVYLVDKIVNLRIWEDEDGKMNRSLLEVGGEALVVSQFTLYADTRKGRRPSFIEAALPKVANLLVDGFSKTLQARGIPTQSGVFGAHMLVEIANDGPVTIWLENSP